MKRVIGKLCFEMFRFSYFYLNFFFLQVVCFIINIHTRSHNRSLTIHFLQTLVKIDVFVLFVSPIGR